jgi:hypothetical protein
MHFFSEDGALGSNAGRDRLVGYLKVASAEADLMGDEALRRRIDGLIEDIPALSANLPNAEHRHDADIRDSDVGLVAEQCHTLEPGRVAVAGTREG